MNAIPDIARSVHLSASAGSGKTRALKERYLALLDRLDQSGLAIDQAVAITFTDKAAAEIKERVMRDLPEPMLKKIIRGRQDLRISTIHSFCMNLLKRYPLEAGLPPDFGVLDARDQASKAQKAVEDALEGSDEDPGIMSPLRDFSADDLIGTVGFLLSVRGRLKRLEIDAGGQDELLRSLRSAMGTGQAASDIGSLIKSEEWRRTLRKMEAVLRTQGDHYEKMRGKEHLAFAETKDVSAAVALSRSLMTVYFNKDGTPGKNPSIAKKAYAGNNRKEYEDLFFRVQDMLVRFRALSARMIAGQESVSLFQLFLRAEERYQDAKLREGLLDFDDLEIYAYRLLRSADSPDVLYWLDRKVLHFLVDEFQDTSDIQWAVMNALTEEIFAGKGADKPMHPTLFVVGDAKQSIYRFREANYRLIEDVRRKIEANIPAGSREIRTLDRNYRSAPEVVGTVNTVFSALWGEAYQPSEGERTEHAGSVRLIELLPSLPDEGAGGPTEAGVLAKEIKSLIESGTTVYERPLDAHGDGSRTGNRRPAEFKDVAVLIQSRTRLKEYEAALRNAGVPFRVVGGIGFYEEDEVQAVLHTLFFLWNRDDKLSLAAALKSDLFGLTDKDIFELVQGGAGVMAALQHRHPEAWTLLHAWTGLAGLVPLSDLVHRIIGDTGAYIRFGRRNPQAIFNLDKLLDTAREFDRRGYTTLQDFVEWVKNIREAEQREATADMNLPGFQGAVSIMTVHKAKGLEFPVVFLPGLNQQPRSVSSGPRALIEADGGMRMAVKDAANPVYDAMWEREQEELRREHQRLLYVAMTRARDHLIMIGSLAGGRKQIKDNTWLSYLHQAVPSLQHVSADLATALITASHPAWEPRAAAAEKPPAREEKKPKKAVAVDGTTVLGNIRPLPVSEAPEWKKATDFIRDQDREGAVEAPVPQAGTLAPSLLTRGSVLHRCLEELTKTGSYELERIISEYPELHILDRESRERFIVDASSVLRSVTADRELGWIFEKGPGAYSELPFLLRKGRNLISGIIDRVIVKGDQGFVVDYKAIRIENGEALESWKKHYLPQIRVYCEAVKEIFKLRSVEGYLLFLDSSRLEKIMTA